MTSRASCDPDRIRLRLRHPSTTGPMASPETILARPPGEAASVTPVAAAAVIARRTPALARARAANICLALTSRRVGARTATPAGTRIPLLLPLLRLFLPLFLRDPRNPPSNLVFLWKNKLRTRAVTGIASTTCGFKPRARLRVGRGPHPDRVEASMRLLQSCSAPRPHVPTLFLKDSKCGRYLSKISPARNSSLRFQLKVLSCGPAGYALRLPTQKKPFHLKNAVSRLEFPLPSGLGLRTRMPCVRSSLFFETGSRAR